MEIVNNNLVEQVSLKPKLILYLMLSRKPILVTCIMLLMAMTANAQNITITGTVSDNTGPVVGVTVVVQGTVLSGTTDLYGKYSITAPSSATLIFFFAWL